jgi:hypothetical protein
MKAGIGPRTRVRCRMENRTLLIKNQAPSGTGSARRLVARTFTPTCRRSTPCWPTIERAGVDARYVVGDLVGYAPTPNQVGKRLRTEGIEVVMGNYDDGNGFDRDECGCAYVDPVEKALGDRSFDWTKDHTSAANKAWLRSSRRRSGSRPTACASCSSTAARGA